MTNAQPLIKQLTDHISLSDEMRNILSVVDRKNFAPYHVRHLFYTLDSIYMGGGRWIQSPLTAVKIAQCLELKNTHKVLELGCSSGYQATILSKMCQKVYTVDCDPIILDKARKSFETLNINNVHLILALVEKDWEPKETFDRIVFSLSMEEVPNIYFHKLAENGIIIVPLEVADNYQILTKYSKKNGIITIESIEQCLFVSMSDIIKKCDAHD